MYSKEATIQSLVGTVVVLNAFRHQRYIHIVEAVVYWIGIVVLLAGLVRASVEYLR